MFAVLKLLVMNAPEKKTYHVSTAFDGELPKQLYPKHASQFTDVNELHKDYQFRRKILLKNFEAEKDAHLKGEHSEKSLAFLTQKHKEAEMAFEQKYKKLREELELHEKELKASLEKGLE